MFGIPIDPVLQGQLLVAIPATIAATAAWRSARKNERRTRTDNGETMGYLVERTDKTVRSLELRFNEHIMDSWLHRR